MIALKSIVRVSLLFGALCGKDALRPLPPIAASAQTRVFSAQLSVFDVFSKLVFGQLGMHEWILVVVPP